MEIDHIEFRPGLGVLYDKLAEIMNREVNIIPVLQGEALPKVKDSELPDVLPILALRNAVMFPGTVYPVTIGRDKSMRLIREAEEKGLFIGAVPQKDVSVEEPSEADLFEYGVVVYYKF